MMPDGAISLQQSPGLHRQGVVDGAMLDDRRRSSMDPSRVEAFYARALTTYEKQNFNETEALLHEIIALDPAHAGAHRLFGLLHQRLGRNEDALTSFERALELTPNDVASWNDRAALLFRLNRFGEALECLDKLLAIAPEHAETLVNKGAALHKLERLDEAVTCFDRALAIAPRHASALYNRGTSLLKLGQVERALETFDLALVVEPDNVLMLNNRGAVLRPHFGTRSQ